MAAAIESNRVAPSMTSTASAADARAASFGQPSRGLTIRNSRSLEIRHGAGRSADVLAKLRLDENNCWSGKTRACYRHTVS